MIHNRYSSWFNAVITINANQNNIDVYNLINSQTGWNPNGSNKKKLRAFITIQPGVTVSSNSSVTSALTVPAAPFRFYDLIFLINNGNIVGRGGAGGIGVNGGIGNNGSAGGLAMNIQRGVRLINNGLIAGGGGGGGAGGSTQLFSICDFIQQCTCCDSDAFDGCIPAPGECPTDGSGCCGGNNLCWWGAGGGCSFTASQGPNAGNVINGNNVARGNLIPSNSLGGSGGSGQGTAAAGVGANGAGAPAPGLINIVGRGGDGGTYGQPGGNGTAGGSFNGGLGGVGGNWVNGFSNLLISNVGTTFGGAIN